MRVLITTPSALGHVNPIVPLARALRARDHDVLMATAADACAWVQAAGIPVAPAGMDTALRLREFHRQNPQARTLPADQVPDLMFPKGFGAIAAPAMLADLLPLVRRWEPDLIVHDAAEFAGPIVAALVGVASVAKSFGPLTPRHRLEEAGEEVAPLWRSLGLDPRPFAGCYDHLFLDVYPPGLQEAPVTYIPHRQLMRPVPYDGEEPAARTVPLPEGNPDRPLVYLTMGTVFNDRGALETAVDALSELDVRLLVTVGSGGDPAAFGERPPHVRVERYLPQTSVLHRCDVVVSHGGSGTVLATLGLGLPQLCIPQGADQFLNAVAVGRAGAGLALEPPEADGAAIAAAVCRLLEDRSFRNAAGRVSRAIASMPPPDDVAVVLENLAH